MNANWVRGVVGTGQCDLSCFEGRRSHRRRHRFHPRSPIGRQDGLVERHHLGVSTRTVRNDMAGPGGRGLPHGIHSTISAGCPHGEWLIASSVSTGWMTFKPAFRPGRRTLVTKKRSSHGFLEVPESTSTRRAASRAVGGCCGSSAPTGVAMRSYHALALSTLERVRHAGGGVGSTGPAKLLLV